MLCPRCQSDNKPGQHSCWNCLSPLDGALAQRFAQRPPDIAAGKGGAPAKKQAQGFWLAIIVFCFVLLVVSLIAFWKLSDSVYSALPSAAQSMTGASTTASSTTTTTTGGDTAGAATAGAATAGAASTTGPAASGEATSTTTTSTSTSTTGGDSVGGPLAKRNKDALEGT